MNTKNYIKQNKKLIKITIAILLMAILGTLNAIKWSITDKNLTSILVMKDDQMIKSLLWMSFILIIN